MTVFWVEVTDIVFALDSILVAVAIIRQYWVVFSGGVLGIIMMRVAANMFIVLIDRFPKLIRTAYLLVPIAGMRLIIEGISPYPVRFDDPKNIAFWISWIFVGISLISGFTSLPKR